MGRPGKGMLLAERISRISRHNRFVALLFRVQVNGKGSYDVLVYGAFIAIGSALFPEHTTATIEELPEMGYDW